ncbi:MAG TPA: CapA family protein [Bacillota bacterium]|nr:CapA family protein [Bacillota bacterium]
MKAVIKLFCMILLVACLCACAAGANSLPAPRPETIRTEMPADEFNDEQVTIVMVGDLLMHRLVQQSGKAPDGSYNFDHLFACVKSEISAADIAIINQETPLAGEKLGLSGYPMFNAPQEVADAVAKAGFDIVLQATNHTLDRGAEGVRLCREYWAGHFPEVKIAGTALCEKEASEILIVERSGIRVAVLNYTYGTNGIPLPDGMPYIVSLLDEEKVRADTARAREIADFVVICPHWGTEYMHKPSEEQDYWCRIFLECGADLVIGTHPHVIQPVKWYSREDGHKMLVYFSLGNFVNSTAERGAGVCSRMLGGMAKVTIEKDEEGFVSIKDACVIPLVTHLTGGYAGITVYPFSDYSEALAVANTFVRERDPLFSYAYCRELFSNIFGDFLPRSDVPDF